MQEVRSGFHLGTLAVAGRKKMAVSIKCHLQRRVTHHLLKPFREVTRLDHAGCEKVASGVQPILGPAIRADDTELALESVPTPIGNIGMAFARTDPGREAKVKL